MKRSTTKFQVILAEHGFNNRIPEYWYSIREGHVFSTRNRTGSLEHDISSEFPYTVNPEVNMEIVGLGADIGMFL
ncbi:MAG TPA: hypothetical protein ENH07_10325 [Nitrospirae bacterium]|nr:hypothetical protein [Nitrospirota bacterium]